MSADALLSRLDRSPDNLERALALLNDTGRRERGNGAGVGAASTRARRAAEGTI